MKSSSLDNQCARENSAKLENSESLASSALKATHVHSRMSPIQKKQHEQERESSAWLRCFSAQNLDLKIACAFRRRALGIGDKRHGALSRRPPDRDSLLCFALLTEEPLMDQLHY